MTTWLRLTAALLLLAALPFLTLCASPRRERPVDADEESVADLVRLAESTAPAPPPVGRLRVLFIGNSLTRVNDLPATIAYLAAAGGAPPFTWVRDGIDGGSLGLHARQGRAPARIRLGGWSHVVIQDHSTAALSFPAALDRHGRDFVRSARAAGAQPVLYQTWAAFDRPEDQDVITAAYAALAVDGAVVAPVGEAFRRALASTPQPDLYVFDGLHPSAAGTYLVACVFYATFFGRSPVGLPGDPPHFYRAIPPATATVLQRAAQDAATAAGLLKR